MHHCVDIPRVLEVSQVEGALGQEDEVHRVSLRDVMLNDVADVADKLEILHANKCKAVADHCGLSDVHLLWSPPWIAIEELDQVFGD